MKKSTLLVGLGLLAGCFAAEAQEMVRGIKISTDTEKYYYRISNMRAQRLNYTTGAVAGFDDITGEADWGDVYDVDNAAKRMLPMFLADGFPEDIVYGTSDYTDLTNLAVKGQEGDTQTLLEEEGFEDFKLTPQPYKYPYMGLVIFMDQFWCAFSAQDDVMNLDTTFWYFTSTDGSKVQIHNAVIEGTIKREHTGYIGETKIRTVGFDTKDNNYYVIGLKDLFENEGFDMSLNDHQLETAFALGTSSNITTSGSNCLDVNNHITNVYTTNQVDPATGEPILNEETEEPIAISYGFAGMERTWSPLRNNAGANENHLYNNGGVFFVDEAATADAEAAIERYKLVVAETYRKGAVALAKTEYLNVAQQMKGWLNVPGLWIDQDALRAIIAECENYTTEATGVNNLATQEAFVEKAAKAAKAKLVQAAHLVGTGAVVTFQNLTAFRDLESFGEMIDNEDEDEIEEYQPGNAFISAGCPGWYKNGTWEEADYTGIAPKLVADANCEWELVPVEGDITFLLYNKATNTYIRKYVDMYDYAGGEDVIGEVSGIFEANWATTEDKTMAAPFQLVACADPEKQAAPTDAQETLIVDFDVNTTITDNVRLETYNTVPQLDEDGEPVLNDLGEPATVTTKYAIHRGSAASDYRLINWNAPTADNWYADSNVFHVGVVKEGGINEISADNVKATGIYDLQGRRVANPAKGLYIINGTKTIIR